MLFKNTVSTTGPLLLLYIQLELPNQENKFAYMNNASVVLALWHESVFARHYHQTLTHLTFLLFFKHSTIKADYFFKDLSPY
jgi:hypothetical protein